jgi:hypothetical protein
VWGAAGSDNNFDEYGIYFDEVNKIDGAWRFIGRVYVPS